MFNEARQEQSFVVFTIDEGVSCITILFKEKFKFYDLEIN